MWLNSQPPKRKPPLLCSSAAPHEGLCMQWVMQRCLEWSPAHQLQLFPLTFCSNWQTREKDMTAINLKKKKSPGHPLTRCCKHVTHDKFFKLNYLLHVTRYTQLAASPCFPEKWHIWQRDNSGLTSTALVCICPSAWLDIRFEFWWVRDDGRANSRLGEITITIFQPKSCCWYISLARCQLQWNPGWLKKEIKQMLYSSNWKNFPNTRKKISLDHTGLMKINITTL